jgi:hypothetical protein
VNWEAIGAFGEILGAAAVVATLFYLAVQIKESSAQARRNELNSTLQQISAGRLALAQNEKLATILPKGLENFSSLDSGERIRFEAIMNERFWVMQQLWQRVQDGYLNQEYWDGSIHGATIQTIHTPGGAAWWEASNRQFPANYREEIERIRGLEGSDSSAPK